MRLYFAVALFAGTSCALAQSAGGLAGISGTVHDASGSSVPNAKVVVSNDTNGTKREITTNQAGLFAARAGTRRGLQGSGHRSRVQRV